MDLKRFASEISLMDIKVLKISLDFVAKYQKLNDTLTDEYDYMKLYEFIYGVQEDIRLKKVTEEELLESENRYIRDNNTVLKWLDTEPKISNEPIGLVYQEYTLWSQMGGFRPLNRINFGKELSKEGWVSKPTYLEGKTVRIYLKEE